VDDYNKHTWTSVMHAKSQTWELLYNFVTKVTTQFGKTIKTIRSDSGPEFDYTILYNTHGINHQRSCVETPQQNSIVERKH